MKSQYTNPKGREIIKGILEGKTAAIINLGCKVNKYEADAMKKKLAKSGIKFPENDKTDIYIVNTCSVTNIAGRKSRQMLRRAKKQNPNAVIVAVGCYVNAAYEELHQNEWIDIVIGNHKKKDIVWILERYYHNEKKKEVLEKQDTYIDINDIQEYEEMGSAEAAYLDRDKAYIKIQDGCNQFCTYCMIPYIRGRARSRNPENIMKEVKTLSLQGMKEFVLTGIHISSYGEDFESGMPDLKDLIQMIKKVNTVKTIYLGSLEPSIITEAFLESLKDNEQFYPHFHLSLQSACNATLARMNRKYTIEEYKQKCNMIRSFFKEARITTDIIVGFPKESEEEFAITYQNLKELNLYKIHVFPYSPRKGTKAETMAGQVSEQVKNERSKKLLDLSVAIF